MNQSIQVAISQVVPTVVGTGLTKIHLATYQAPDGTFDAAGAPSENYADIPGLVNMPIANSPPSDARVQATEVRALAEITSSELQHIWHPGYYPVLSEGWRGDSTPAGPWRVLLGDNDGAGNLINGYAYLIMGVEYDSQNQSTRVQVKLATL